jgi:hypothetical protein
VAAHIVIRGFHGFGNLGVPLLEGPEFKSTTLDAIWWEPIGARSYLVLGNSSNETVHAEIIFGSGAKQGVDLPPFATQTKPFLYGSDDGPAEGRISFAQITYSGTPGTLRAAGFSTSFSEHFFDTIAFVDPKLSTESALYANGLHLADVSGHLLVKNISDTPIAVSGGIYPLGRARSMKPFPVLPKSLAAGESVELPLPVSGRLDGAAAWLESSGGAASMIAAFSSIEPTHRMVRSVPFTDTRSSSALTGGYLWRIDGDYTSTVSITNIGGSRAAIAGFIRPNGGKDYKIDTKYLEAGETAFFDVRQIRDQQIPDRKGVKLPKNATTGQFEWSSILGDGAERLVGRAEISSLSLGAFVPLTDTNCDCPNSAVGAFVDPVDPFVPVGGKTSALTEVEYRNVCNDEQSDDPFDALLWTIEYPDILSLTKGESPSIMKGLAGGVSDFSTTFTGETWTFSPTLGCQHSTATYPLDGAGTVQLPTSLRVVSSQVISNTWLPSCLPTYFGITIQINYQVLDQYGANLASANMEPQEEILNEVINGTPIGNPEPTWVDIWNANYPGSTQFTNAGGQFLDAPFWGMHSHSFCRYFYAANLDAHERKKLHKSERIAGPSPQLRQGTAVLPMDQM